MGKRKPLCNWTVIPVNLQVLLALVKVEVRNQRCPKIERYYVIDKAFAAKLYLKASHSK
jgi:hypothetical protein